jgi:hypothetical protein
MFRRQEAPTMIETVTERAQRSATEQAASGRRLDAVREILRALETATAAGQQHLMMKVLGLLRREAPAGDHWMDDRQWNKIAAGLEVLAHEANRLAPNADTFKRHATIVADALALQ